MSIGNYGIRGFRHGGGVAQRGQAMGVGRPGGAWQQGIASGVTPRAPRQVSEYSPG